MKLKQATKPTAGYYVSISFMTVFFLLLAVTRFTLLAGDTNLTQFLTLIFVYPLLLAAIVSYIVIWLKYRNLYGKILLHLIFFFSAFIVVFELLPVTSHLRNYGIYIFFAIILFSLVFAIAPWIKLIIDKRRNRT